MGRQIQFHMVQEDLDQLLRFVQRAGSVAVVVRDSAGPLVEPVSNPGSQGAVLALWNRELLATLERRLVHRTRGDDYYTVDHALPTLELSPSRLVRWQGREGLLQGRVYQGKIAGSPGFDRWYATVARWIRTHTEKSPAGFERVYIGPATKDWFLAGGVLLPNFVPPLTPAWSDFFANQDESRRRLARR